MRSYLKYQTKSVMAPGLCKAVPDSAVLAPLWPAWWLVVLKRIFQVCGCSFFCIFIFSSFLSQKAQRPQARVFMEGRPVVWLAQPLIYWGWAALQFPVKNKKSKFVSKTFLFLFWLLWSLTFSNWGQPLFCLSVKYLWHLWWPAITVPAIIFPFQKLAFLHACSIISDATIMCILRRRKWLWHITCCGVVSAGKGILGVSVMSGLVEPRFVSSQHIL